MEVVLRFPRHALSLGVFACLACSGKSGNYGCGFAAMAGQSMLLDQFNRPGMVLGELPARIPAAVPVRVALGPAFHSVTGKADSLLIVGVEGSVPANPPLGFGVLIVHPTGRVDGVLLYQGDPIQGAPRLGTVNLGSRDIPLIGLRVDISQFEKRSCPVFPDSLRG